MYRHEKNGNRKVLDVMFSSPLAKHFILSIICLASFSGLSAQLDVQRVMTIGRNALYFSDYMVAIDYFNKVLEIRPWMADPYFFRGYAKMMLEDYAGAEKDASLALERNAFLKQAYLIRALSKHSQKNYNAAKEDYITALRLNPDDVSIRFNLAGTLYELKDYPKADSLAQSIPQQDRIYPMALLLRSDIALKQGDTIRSEQLVTESIKADSTSAQAHAFFAELYRLNKKLPQAIAQLDKAMELAPNEAQLYSSRGLLRYQSNDYMGAISDYDKALELAQNDVIARFNRALLRSFLGDNNNALADFIKVLEAQPNNDIARFNAALLQNQLGKYNEAVSNLSVIIKKHPNFLPAYYARSEAKALNGDRSGSERDQYEAYQRQKQLGSQANKNNTKKKNGSNPTRNEDEQALDDYKSLIASNPENIASDATLPESLRGRVQDRVAEATHFGVQYLTFFIPEKLLSTTKFDARLSSFNAKHYASQPLYATAERLALDSIQAKQASNKLSELNAHVKNSSSYYFMRGLYKFALVDFDEALTDFDKALSVDSDNALARLMRATTKLRIIDLNISEQNNVNSNSSTKQVNENAFTVMGKKSIAPTQPSNAIVRNSKVQLAYNDIIQDLDLLITKHPDMAIAIYNRAVVSERLGNNLEAINYYNRVIAMPNTPNEAYFNRALLFLAEGKRNEAIADFSKAGELGIYQAYNILKRIR